MSAFDNDRKLTTYCEMYERNFQMCHDIWLKDRIIDIDLIREMHMFWTRMEELIPQSHLDAIKNIGLTEKE